MIKLKVMYRIGDRSITQHNVVRVWVYPDGLTVGDQTQYISFQCWSKGFNRYYYESVYNKPEHIFMEKDE